MKAFHDASWQPLAEAIEEWAAALSAVDGDIHRVLKGGVADSAVMALLLAAVEQAQLRCLRTALKIQREHPQTR